ncbi:MAG: PorV/PorQ family protein [Candidatus Marinimicrobia bacterium]|nr:PorV/PorQ family protein [Candidatus Neomarinimicrobiota bacterium]
MIRKHYLRSIFIWGFILSGLPAQDFAPVGTAIAQFLEIGVGAHAGAMGQAFTARTNDAGSVFWNPAGLADAGKYSLYLSNTTWPADISLGSIAISGKFGRLGTFAISTLYLQTDDMEITTIEESDGTGEYFSISNSCLGLSYARFLTDRVSVGITGKIVQEKYLDYGYSTWAIDLGTMYRTDFHGLKIGMSILHFGIGDIQFDGDYTDYSNQDSYIILEDDTDDSAMVFEKYSLPVNFRVGISMDIFNQDPHQLTIASDLVHPNNNLEQYNIGLEYGLLNSFFIRGGYKIGVDEGGLSFGGGASLNAMGFGNVKVDYSYSDLGILTNSHRFSLLLAL